MCFDIVVTFVVKTVVQNHCILQLVKKKRLNVAVNLILLTLFCGYRYINRLPIVY